MNTQPIASVSPEICRAAIMRTMRRVIGPTNEPKAPPAHLYLYRHAGNGRYLASRQPLSVRSADLEPQFGGKPAPAVVCAAFIRQFGRV